MRFALRAIVIVAVLGSFQTAALHTAGAQGYPTRAITLIVPYPAGGPSDTLARIMSEPLKAALGQSVVVENVTGAGGGIGTGRVAKADPDGYTIGIGHNQTHVINGVNPNLAYDVVKDFEPVTLIADTPIWIVARKNLPANDIKEFIAWLKQPDTKASSGAVGVGGPGDIAVAAFQRQTDTRFPLVPYRGGAPVLQDLLSGQIDFTFGQAATYVPYIRNGQLKALAVLTPKRWWAAPDVPTLDEAGIKDIYAGFWHGIWVPKGTPKPIVDKLNAAFSQTLTDATVQKRFQDIGQEIFPASQQSPAALAAKQKAEIERWWPVIKAAGIKIE
ncbi:MAG: tripartite tricarboxylate transporter substrate binding protein BugD [Xanthobacteraceae bacterium]|nr:tripartite tricarboxylate transporter substrate binding protein BugD [Xanthobacteraceae bacterium]